MFCVTFLLSYWYPFTLEYIYTLYNVKRGFWLGGKKRVFKMWAVYTSPPVSPSPKGTLNKNIIILFGEGEVFIDTILPLCPPPLGKEGEVCGRGPAPLLDALVGDSERWR